MYLCLIFLFKNRDQRPKIELCIKLQPNWKKDEGALISISVSGGWGVGDGEEELGAKDFTWSGTAAKIASGLLISYAVRQTSHLTFKALQQKQKLIVIVLEQIKGKLWPRTGSSLRMRP